ncbi:MAG: RecX family transcriptional regulator [Clostridia bacterium]
MCFIIKIIEHPDKHEADISTQNGDFRVTSADLSTMNIAEGENADDDQTEKIAFCDQKLKCLKKSFTYLSYGDLSFKKLKEKLRKNFEKEVIETVAAILTEKGYVNDDEIAQRYAESFLNSKLFGASRIKNELYKRGFSTESINNALDEIDSDIYERNIFEIIDKKFGTVLDGDVSQKAKITAYLRRMGYSYGEVSNAIYKQ